VLAGLLQTHATLKEHALLLEATLADRASTDVRLDSAVRDELEKRDRAIADATNQIQQLENEVAKERQNLKDLRTQVIVNLQSVTACLQNAPDTVSFTV
jgi:predicted  nucleic acid-binding Zn-ribbon protein